MIEVTGLTKNYGPRRAIDKLNFNVHKGEILGFLGPNGAGKTTTMRILAGYMPPTRGTAKIGGFDLIKNSIDIRRMTGYLPETVPLYNDMTVFAYLKYMADLRHLRNGDDRVEEAILKVDMKDRAHGYIGNLSKGMRQRVGLAQAILHSPEVLILDEPTIGLDPSQIIEVRNLIRELGKKKTILLSTHILSEAQQICNRVLIINKGRIVVEDTPEKLQLRISGAHNILLRVAGSAEGLIPSITKLKGVSEINNHGDDTLEIKVTPSVDARPEIARAVIKNGFDLLELRAANLSLEEIFLQLTHDDSMLPEAKLDSEEEEE